MATRRSATAGVVESHAVLDLAGQSVRLAPTGRAIALEAGGPIAGEPAPTVASLGSGDWTSRFGGREWRYDYRGVYTRDFAEGQQPWRTNGQPLTVRTIWAEMGGAIVALGRKHGVNPALVLMTIATEVGYLLNAGFTGPLSFRWEPAVWNDDVQPPFAGSYSAGPMQTLASTARETISLFGRE